MASSLQETNLDDINWGSLSREQLEDVAANDDRSTAQAKAREELTARDTPPNLDLSDYDPRNDPGPERREDQVEAAVETPLSAEEVSLEESRKDETTVLATDRLRVNDQNEVKIANE